MNNSRPGHRWSLESSSREAARKSPGASRASGDGPVVNANPLEREALGRLSTADLTMWYGTKNVSRQIFSSGKPSEKIVLGKGKHNSSPPWVCLCPNFP